MKLMIPNRGIGVRALATLMMVGLPHAGFAQQGTPQEREACEADVYRLCSDKIPDVQRIVACLNANSPKLSAACRKVMAADEKADKAEKARK